MSRKSGSSWARRYAKRQRAISAKSRTQKRENRTPTKEMRLSQENFACRYYSAARGPHNQ